MDADDAPREGEAAGPLPPAAVAVLVVTAFFGLDHLREFLAWTGALDLLPTGWPGEATVITWKILQVPLTVAAVMALHRQGVRLALAELGVHGSPGPGLARMFVATLPLALGYGLMGGWNPELSAAHLVMTGVASPVSEELLYRGFLVRQLWIRARWPFWLAILVNAVPFGWSHLYQASDLGAGLAGAAAVVAVTGIGAAVFAWLMVRWDGDLWAAIGYHAFANIWFYLFDAGRSAVSSGPTFAVTAGGAVCVVAFTVWRTGGWRVDRARVLRGARRWWTRPPTR